MKLESGPLKFELYLPKFRIRTARISFPFPAILRSIRTCHSARPVSIEGESMGFLIRTAFWFSLVLLILPLNIGPGKDGQQSVSPFQAFFAAREAVGDVTE